MNDRLIYRLQEMAFIELLGGFLMPSDLLSELVGALKKESDAQHVCLSCGAETYCPNCG